MPLGLLVARVQTLTWPGRHDTVLLLFSAVAMLLSLGAIAPSGAAAQRAVQFDGRSVEVPKGWSVYRLAEHPRMCVRMDRRAV